MTAFFYFRDLISFASSLTLKRAKHLFLCYSSYRISLWLSKPVVWGLPVNCSIEPTTRCNLKCPECPTGNDSLRREKGDMILSDFQQLTGQIAPHTLYLSLYLQGEPFLNKELPKMISCASGAGIYTSLSTNGHFISRGVAEEIVRAGLRKIIFSVDGATQESYEKYRKNGQLTKVLEGIKTLNEVKKHFRKKYPLVVIQFIVFRSNEHELDDIRKMAANLKVDKLEIKTAQHYALESTNHMLTSKEKHSRYKISDGKLILKSKPAPCSRIWTTSVITWNKLLVPCCYDKDANYTMGNLNEQNLKSLWNSDKFNRFRKTVLNEIANLEICRNCGENQ
jgi:radical SAM protein with 4Fe4S-binding SPASM domain